MCYNNTKFVRKIMVNKIKVTEVAELMALIDHDRNMLEGIDISNLYVNSSKIINWKCENEHIFKEKINVIYRRKHKCFYCTGRQVWSGENDLKTLYPEIAKEFDVEKNKITPDKISPKLYHLLPRHASTALPRGRRRISHRPPFPPNG